MSKKISVEGKVALVSGANRGIGKATVIELLEKGASKVYAGARDTSKLDDLSERFGDRLVPIVLDVTDDTLIESLASMAGDVEILINNAGVLDMGNFGSGNVVETLQSNFEVNVYGVVKVTSTLLDAMKNKESGAVVIISSMVGLASMPMGLSYSASKAAIHSVIQGLRGELVNSNILVAGVYPGPIETDMTKGFEMDKDSPENVAKHIVEGIENGTEDIFPDAMSQQMGGLFMANPKEVEKQFSNFA